MGGQEFYIRIYHDGKLFDLAVTENMSSVEVGQKVQQFIECYRMNDWEPVPNFEERN